MESTHAEDVLAELARDTANDVGYHAVRWWVDEANPHRVLIVARSPTAVANTTIILIAHLPG
jgi:hypothetical protein